MKTLCKLLSLIVALSLITACSQQQDEDVLQNAVPGDTVQDLFIGNPDAAQQAQSEPESTAQSSPESTTTQHIPTQEEIALALESAGVVTSDYDIDLTTMSDTMVYSQVYDIMVNYTAYMGQSINLVGQFNSLYYEEIAQTLSFVIINDALGCCPQGLELRFEGDVTLPDVNSNISIQGEFTTYKEGDFEFFCIMVENITVI